MPILWHRFDEESALPAIFTAAEQAQLAAIFDDANPASLWRRALAVLGLPAPLGAPLLYWHQNAPYINWSAMVALVSGGALRLVRKADGFSYQERYSPLSVWRLIKAQWQISRYIYEQCTPDCPLPEAPEARLVESLALGLCLLALTMRVSGKDAALLHAGLADSSALPRPYQAAIKQIQAVQKRRNLLSPAWRILFPPTAVATARPPLPRYFWDAPPVDPLVVKPDTIIPEILPAEWRGIPVAGGMVSGHAVVIRTAEDIARAQASPERLILIFPLAKPETVELFPFAAAVLYGTGGALCHACSIAREQNLCCLTALGADFITAISTQLAENPALTLVVAPAERTVRIGAGAAQN